MDGYSQTKQGQWLILIVILIGSEILLLANLGNQYMWQDEAQTALISKTILTDGVPRGYDGKNYFSQERGADCGKNYIWRWHMWLPFYVLAGFYKVLGVNTVVSRLPFALFGMGTVALLFFFAKLIWPRSRIPAIAASLLAISVPFLLLCRQCRYYSMVTFFSLLSLYAYVLMLEGKKFASALLVVATTLLFHSQHIYVAVFFPAVFVHAVVVRRDRLKTLSKATALVILINIPWLVWISGMNGASPFLRLQQPKLIYGFLNRFVIDLSCYVFPVWLLGILLVAQIIRRVRTGRFFVSDKRFWEMISLFVLFVAFNIITASVIAPGAFFRYMAPAIPLLILLAAVIINAAWEAHLLIAAATVILLVTTSQMKDYLYEITHDYYGPEEGIAKYLNEHGSPDDIVAITFGDMSLKFYTKLKVVGGLTGEDLSLAQNARWVIIRKYAICDIDKKVRTYLKENIPLQNFHKITINYPDIPFENRESPTSHFFRTVTNESKVVIYENPN